MHENKGPTILEAEEREREREREEREREREREREEREREERDRVAQREERKKEKKVLSYDDIRRKTMGDVAYKVFVFFLCFYALR